MCRTLYTYHLPPTTIEPTYRILTMLRRTRSVLLANLVREQSSKATCQRRFNTFTQSRLACVRHIVIDEAFLKLIEIARGSWGP